MSDPLRNGKVHRYVHPPAPIGVQSVHMWGFFDENGGLRSPEAAPSEQTVHQALQRVASNVKRRGGELTNTRTTRTLDGWLVGVEFEVLAHGNAAHMWHRITTPREEWPA